MGTIRKPKVNENSYPNVLIEFHNIHELLLPEFSATQLNNWNVRIYNNVYTCM